MRMRNNGTASKRGQESAGVECESALSDLVRQMWSNVKEGLLLTSLSVISLLVACYLYWTSDFFNRDDPMIFVICCFLLGSVGGISLAFESFKLAYRTKREMLGMERCEFHQTEVAESAQGTDAPEHLEVADADPQLVQVMVTA